MKPVGNTWLPDHRRSDGRHCPGRAGYLRDIPGEHIRTCYCGTTYIAVITVAAWASAKCGREVLKVTWLDTQREVVA